MIVSLGKVVMITLTRECICIYIIDDEKYYFFIQHYASVPWRRLRKQKAENGNMERGNGRYKKFVVGN